VAVTLLEIGMELEIDPLFLDSWSLKCYSRLTSHSRPVAKIFSNNPISWYLCPYEICPTFLSVSRT
jgi:hypothetical protein